MTNLAVLRRFVDEVLNQGPHEILPDLIHPDYRYYGPDGGPVCRQEGLRQLIADFRQGFSDLTARVTGEIEQAERIALTMTLSGTHDGEFDGITPTVQRLELPVAVPLADRARLFRQAEIAAIPLPTCAKRDQASDRRQWHGKPGDYAL